VKAPSLVGDQLIHTVCDGTVAALSTSIMKNQFETISMTDLATVDGGTFKSAFQRGVEEAGNGGAKGERNGTAVAGPLGAKVGKGIGTVGGFFKGVGLDIWDDLRNR
jgi:hypothetical protein